MKHFLLCLISYIYLLTKCARAVAWTVLVWTSDLSAVKMRSSLVMPSGKRDSFAIFYRKLSEAEG